MNKHKKLSPRQNNFISQYTEPTSNTFGNSYRSAIAAGYSHQTARNLTHLAPGWLSENIGQMAVIQPEEIMQELTAVIADRDEPTIIRLKAMEMSMRAYNMLHQRQEQQQAQLVSMSIDLSGN